MAIQAIATHYDGYLFRSRLEARWAVLFNRFGIRYQYEPQGFRLADGQRYLPDFWLESVSMWAEVKPELFTPDAEERCKMLVAETGHDCLLLDGVPTPRAYRGYCLMDEIGVVEMDWHITNEYLHEHRFFASTGCGCAWRQDACRECYWAFDDYRDAYEAARSARFEHGEMPAGRGWQ